MPQRYEFLSVRFTYNPVTIKSDKELEGLIDNLKTPLLALLKSYMNRGVNEINLKLKIDGDRVGAVVEVNAPTDSDVLADFIRNTVPNAIEGTYGVFPDKIEIVYYEKPEHGIDGYLKGVSDTVRFSGKVSSMGDKLVIVVPKKLHGVVKNLGDYVDVILARYGSIRRG